MAETTPSPTDAALADTLHPDIYDSATYKGRAASQAFTPPTKAGARDAIAILENTPADNPTQYLLPRLCVIYVPHDVGGFESFRISERNPFVSTEKEDLEGKVLIILPNLKHSDEVADDRVAQEVRSGQDGSHAA